MSDKQGGHLKRKNLKALLMGHVYELTLAPVPILIDAGFEVDVLCTECTNFNSQKFNTIPLQDSSLIFSANKRIKSYEYDLIVLGDDKTIGEVIDSSISQENKLKLLPVISTEYFFHLFSKCELSKILNLAKISTPEFIVINTNADLFDVLKKLDYPLYIKIDRSGGGTGVFECNSENELLRKTVDIPFPILLQKKIVGEILDLSAFYHKTQLVYFSYSIFHKTIKGELSPSSARIYLQLGMVPQEIFSELTQLGKVLGANGFVSITCIQENITGKRFYIEADMRPNAWVNYGRFVGNKASLYLKSYFGSGNILSFPQAINHKYPQRRLIGFPDRLKIWEVICNRYETWHCFDDFRSIYTYIRFRIDYELIFIGQKFLKPYLPRKVGEIGMHFYKRCYLFLDFDNFTYSTVSYKCDLALRIFCSKHIKPFLSKRIWNIGSSLYRRILNK